MKITLAGLLLLVANTAQAAPPDDPTTPNPNDPVPTPDPTIPDPTRPGPIYEPTLPAPTIPAPTEPAPVPITQRTEPTPMTVVVNPVIPLTRSEDWWSMDKAGFAISVGGGVEGFTNSAVRDTTKDGGDWNVRASFGTRLPLGFEASYLGSLQTIDALGLDTHARLVGNGVQGDLRLNVTTNQIIQPYLFGGVAWRRYSLNNVAFNTSDISSSDDVLEVPVGLGLAYKMKGLVLDARGEFRGSFYDNLVPEPNTTSNSTRLHRWGVNANIGYEF